MIPSAARNALADTLWDLLEQKNVDSLTVADIAKARSITRQAFYYHFQSLNDLLAYATDRYVTGLTDKVLAAKDAKAAIALAFSPAKEHPEVIQNLMRSKKYPVYRYVSDTVSRNVERVLLDRRVTRDLGYDATEMAVRFYAGGLLNVIAGACKEEYIHTGWMADQYLHLLYGDLLPPRGQR